MPSSVRTTMWVFGTLSAAMAAGYGVLFTVVGDFRDEYGISESQVGFIIGLGFLSAFIAQVFIAPVADRGHPIRRGTFRTRARPGRLTARPGTDRAGPPSPADARCA